MVVKARVGFQKREQRGGQAEICAGARDVITAVRIFTGERGTRCRAVAQEARAGEVGPREREPERTRRAAARFGHVQDARRPAERGAEVERRGAVLALSVVVTGGRLFIRIGGAAYVEAVG